jgi:hypothetical protein
MVNRIRNLMILFGYVVAFTCIGWVMIHLVCCYFWGAVTVLEPNTSVLVTEISLLAVGSCCLASSIYRSAK